MSLLIKNVQIVDGSGKKPYKGDILIQQEKISAIGNLKSKQTEKSIDGLGNYLIPAFVDPAATSDRYLDILVDPEQSRLKEQGIGTVIGGNGGISLAPLIYGRLDSLIKRWPDAAIANTDWHSMEEFFKSLRRFNLGVNFGSLAGYETVKEAVTGEENRELTRNEIKVAGKVIDNALKEGAFGVSINASYVSAAGRGEIKTITDLVNKHHGFVSLSIDVKNGAERIKKIIGDFSGKHNKTKILVTDFWPLVGHERVFEEVISSASGNVRFSVKPYPGVIYEALEILPSWITKDRSRESAYKALSEEDVAEKVKQELLWIDPEKALVLSSPNHEILRGKTIKELSEMYGLPAADTIIKIIKTCRLKFSFLYQSANEEILLKHINDRNIFVSGYSDSRFAGLIMDKQAEKNSFTRAVEAAVESHSLPIEDAVKSVSSAPAKFLNIKNRGVVKEGYAADLVIIDKDNFKTTYSIVGGLIGGTPLRHGW